MKSWQWYIIGALGYFFMGIIYIVIDATTVAFVWFFLGCSPFLLLAVKKYREEKKTRSRIK